jgi:PAS domain S-box-containing protein
VALAMHARARAGHRVEVPRHLRSIEGREACLEGTIDAVPMEDGTGLLITTREVARELGWPHEVAQALRMSEARFRTMADESPIIIWVTDARGHNEFVNRTYRDFFGVVSDEVEGTRWRPLVHPEDETRYLGDFLRAVREREPFSGEARVRREDGEWRWIASYGQPRYAATGEFLGHVGISQDITDRKRAEQGLAMSEERFRVLVTATSDVVYRMSPDWSVMRQLNSRKFIADTDEPIANWLEKYIPPDDQPLVTAAIDEAIRTKSTFELEHRVLRVDGSLGWTLSRAVPLLDASGAITEWFGLATDVTDRKRAEEEARLADQRKSEFLGVLSHELRNPLAPIRNSVYLLERAAPASETSMRARGIIRRQVEHLTRLVDDLLDVTRISRGKIALQRRRVDLREIVRETTDDLRSVFSQAGVELHVDHVLGAVWIDADRTRMTQVLGNLLQNSVKFTPRGGTVTVALGTKGDRAEMCVRDNGIGMQSGSIEHMFEPFAQAEMSLARTKGGLGLGLPLVKGLVELHGGTVEARSPGTGCGAEFVVRLPLAETGTEARHEHRAAAEPPPLVILVIEDNLDAGQSLADVLEIQGHRVHVARDGRSGLALARELRPDVVLCDIGLPDIDGYDVARELRGDDAARTTRLVALSGYAQPEDRQRACDAGFDAHIAKPPDIDELVSVLASVS